MDNQETLITNSTILEAINGLRQDFKQTNERLDRIEQRLTNVENRLTNLENKVNRIDERLMNVESEVFSVNVRLLRIESMAHESVSIAKSVQADVVVLKAEVHAWSRDVMDLQRKVA